VPLTEIVTESACAVVILDVDGVTNTVGVVLVKLVTVTGVEPVDVM
jgi:hypothetical protein